MTKYWNMTTPASGDSSSVDLWIFGDIVDPETEAVDRWFGLDTGEKSARSIEEAISDLPAETQLTVHINSFGGSVAEGLAIYNVLKQRSNCRTIVEGFACSAASIVFMAGKERVMNEASLLMLHKPWVATAGNATDLQADIDSLKAIETAMISAYCTSGIDEEKARDLIEGSEGQGTWITAGEAVEMNLATGLADYGDDPETAQNSAWRAVYARLTAPATRPTEDILRDIRETLDHMETALNSLRNGSEKPEKTNDDLTDGKAGEQPRTVADMMFDLFK